MSNNRVFAIFYLSIISVCLFGSLYTNHLNSNGNAVPDDNLNGQAIFSADAEAYKQVISVFTSANYTWMNFSFTWGSDTQKIVPGDFHLKVYMRWGNETIGTMTTETLTIYIEANDDDFEGWDYVGIVFDTNQDGYIDIRDDSIVLFANNMTQPSFLIDHGFLAFAECMPIRGPHRVSFNVETGYIFSIKFPPGGHTAKNPIQSIKDASRSPIHICFYDNDLAMVFVRFSFQIPEGWK